jgi:hypothetical protein
MVHLDPFTRCRLEQGAEYLEHAGCRVIGEFLAEIATDIGGLPCILGRLNEYQQRVCPVTLRALGGEKFAPRLRAVPR